MHYLFSDPDFVNRLSVEKPGIFQKIYDEIKYLVKTATAGSKEAKQLMEVQRAFEKAYKEKPQKEFKGKYDIDYEKLIDFVHQVEDNNGQTNFEYNQHRLTAAPKNVAEGIRQATGGRVNVENKYFALEGGKLSHELINHGDVDKEASRGQKSYSSEDIEKIIETMMEPDVIEDISSGDKINQRNSIAFAKEIDGEMVVIAAIGGKRNPNIVPEQILWFTRDKWNQIEESGKTLREVIYENSNKRGKLTDEEIENIKKNRVTVVHGESNDSSARYVQDVPRSPLIKSISQNGENTIPTYSINEDSQGRKLSDEQIEFFKESKVRDENGALTPVYHGTQSDFTIFDITKNNVITFGKLDDPSKMLHHST